MVAAVDVFVYIVVYEGGIAVFVFEFEVSNRCTYGPAWYGCKTIFFPCSREF